MDSDDYAAVATERADEIMQRFVVKTAKGHHGTVTGDPDMPKEAREAIKKVIDIVSQCQLKKSKHHRKGNRDHEH